MYGDILEVVKINILTNFDDDLIENGNSILSGRCEQTSGSGKNIFIHVFNEVKIEVSKIISYVIQPDKNISNKILEI